MRRFFPRMTLLLTVAALLFFPPTITTAADDKIPTQQGTIIEATDASGYTYLHLDTGTTKIWVAIPQTSVNKGDVVSFLEGMTMTDFYSKTLDKRFDSIIFSPGLSGEAPGENSPKKMPAASPGSSFAAAVQAEAGNQGKPAVEEPLSAGSSGAVVPLVETAIEKLPGENSYTVGEIFSQAKALDGKKVRLRARVVKFSPNIMAKNWVHLQDGSGDPLQNSHDLVVTTLDQADLDQIVIVEGTVAANKDFGFGYKYDVLIENATLTP